MKKIMFLISLILLSGCSIRSYSSQCGCQKVNQTSIDVGVTSDDDSGCIGNDW